MGRTRKKTKDTVMSGSVIDGPWPQREQTTEARQEELFERKSKATKVKSESANWTRMPLSDRKRVAENLGDLVVELARNEGIQPKQMLRKVWEKTGWQEERWPKRLRYVRLPEDADKKSDEFAGTFADFLALAEAVGHFTKAGGLSEDDNCAAATLRILQGTSRDPDPQRSQAVDFDAARAVAELAHAFISKLEAAVPALPTYFERLAKHQLFHLPHSEDTWKARFLASISDEDKRIFQVWDREDNEEDRVWPVDLDTTHFVSEFTGHQPAGGGPSNTVPPSYVYDGMSLWGDSNANGIAGLLPRIHLGDILTRGLAFKHKASWHDPVVDEDGSVFEPCANDAIHGASSRPLRIYLIVAPVLLDGRASLSLGLIEESWPLTQCRLSDSYITLPTPYHLWPAEPQSELRRWGPIASAPRGLSESGAIELIPGEGSKKRLGMQGVPGIEQLSDELANNARNFEELTPEFLATEYVDVRPAVAIKAGFTPYPANSLASALVSNLLYVSGPQNALEMMIADATSRVDILDCQFRAWMDEFDAAKSQFVKNTNRANLEEK
jgi:hypothetical protein